MKTNNVTCRVIQVIQDWIKNTPSAWHISTELSLFGRSLTGKCPSLTVEVLQGLDLLMENPPQTFIVSRMGSKLSGLSDDILLRKLKRSTNSFEQVSYGRGCSTDGPLKGQNASKQEDGQVHYLPVLLYLWYKE